MNRLQYFAFCIATILISGCAERTETPPETMTDSGLSAPSNATSSKTSYSARGIVLELIPDDQGTFIHHEEIPGFMAEMKMYLKVADQEEFQHLQVGHQYTFEMIVDQEYGTHIQNLVPTGVVSKQSSTGAKPSERWLKEPSFELGDQVPAFTFESTNGEMVTPDILRGQTWAITFIFTRCPLPDYCPMMTYRFKRASEILQEKQVTNWKLISLTIDPEHDRLEVLEEYRKTWEIRSADWYFCRANPEQVRNIGDPLGLNFKSDKFPIEHNLRTAVFDSKGRLIEVFSGNKWTSTELAQSIIRTME